MKFYGQFTPPVDEILSKYISYKGGLSKGMQIKKPFPKGLEDVSDSEFLVLRVPNNAPEYLKKYNNQIVRNQSRNSMGTTLYIQPLSGAKDEGISFKVSIDWVRTATPEEVKHGQYLEKTFFQRDKYDYNTDQFFVFDENEQQIANQAIEALKKTPYLNMAEKLKDNNIQDWLIVLDMLEDIGFDTAELRDILKDKF